MGRRCSAMARSRSMAARPSAITRPSTAACNATPSSPVTSASSRRSTSRCVGTSLADQSQYVSIEMAGCANRTPDHRSSRSRTRASAIASLAPSPPTTCQNAPRRTSMSSAHSSIKTPTAPPQRQWRLAVPSAEKTPQHPELLVSTCGTRRSCGWIVIGKASVGRSCDRSPGSARRQKPCVARIPCRQIAGRAAKRRASGRARSGPVSAAPHAGHTSAAYVGGSLVVNVGDMGVGRSSDVVAARGSSCGPQRLAGSSAVVPGAPPDSRRPNMRPISVSNSMISDAPTA